MSYLIFSLLLITLVFVFGFGWHGLGRTAFPLSLLVVLAVTGGMTHAEVLLDNLLIGLGFRAHPVSPAFSYAISPTFWHLWRVYVSGPLAIALALWLALEIGYRFPGSHPHPRCGKCGYDLTGNTSGICPECGTPCKHVEGTAAERR